MSELKPCVFCGNTNVAHGQFGNKMQVACLGCGSMGPYTKSCVPVVGDVHHCIHEAHDLWNSRPTEKELLEALEDLLAQYMEADGSLSLYEGPLDTNKAERIIAKAKGKQP